MAIEIYVVPTITNTKILPTSSIPIGYLSNQISLRGCPGEFVPATFVVKADEDIIALTPVPGIIGTIPASAVDMYAIKCWWQSRGGKHLTPELMLKDDSLINIEIEDGENYLKKLDGSYMWISDPTPVTEEDMDKRWSIDEIPVQDSDTLQPLDIPAGANKQFWFIIRIPDGTAAGTYTGTIDLQTPGGTLGTITLLLEVLPIDLLQSYLEYGIYYTGRLGLPSISSHRKDATQLRAEYKDMIEHGITSPTFYEGIWIAHPDIDKMETHLSIRNEAGLQDKPLYWIEHSNRANVDPVRAAELLPVAQRQGIQSVFFYGEDESLGHPFILNPDGSKTQLSAEETVQKCAAQVPAWGEIHTLGAKVFVAGVKVNNYSDARRVGEFNIGGEQIDVFIAYKAPSAEEAARWHSIGKRIFSYADPVVGAETPETYRRNYGLRIWQGDYDGAFPWAYNYFTGNPWNPFDSSMDQSFGRPTINGVVDNLAFEGWREGVTDTRYLTTLLNAIDVARSQGHSTSEAENYLATLKAANLSGIDLNQTRRDMVSHILYLQGEPVPPPPPPPTPPLIPGVVWSILPFFPWEGPPVPRFTEWNWTNLPTPT